jgi:hypothetical protein
MCLDHVHHPNRQLGEHPTNCAHDAQDAASPPSLPSDEAAVLSRNAPGWATKPDAVDVARHL